MAEIRDGARVRPRRMAVTLTAGEEAEILAARDRVHPGLPVTTWAREVLLREARRTSTSSGGSSPGSRGPEVAP